MVIRPPLTHSDVALHPSLTDRKEPRLRTGNAGIPPAKLLSPLNPRLSLTLTDQQATFLLLSLKGKYDNRQS